LDRERLENTIMKNKEKLGVQVIDRVLADFSEGLKPLINNFDATQLDEVEKADFLSQLDELEAKALEVKAALNR